jgi:hypothetical protein
VRLVLKKSDTRVRLPKLFWLLTTLSICPFLLRHINGPQTW